MKLLVPFFLMLASTQIGAMGTSQNLRRGQTTCTTLDEYNFEGYSGCSFANDIKDNLVGLLDSKGDSCGNGWRAEIFYLSGESSLAAAKAFMTEECEKRIVRQSCLANGLDSLDLSTIGSCSENVLRMKISEQSQAGCSHNVETEVRLLYRDYMMIPGEDGYLKDGPDVNVASYWLVRECFSEYGCTTYTNGHRLTSCDTDSVISLVEDHLQDQVNCPHDLAQELTILTGTSNYENYIKQMCSDAWDLIAPNTNFRDIDSRFDKNFMELHNEGKEFLNTETGNFRGTNDQDYPVSIQSKTAGQSIDNFLTLSSK